MSEVEVLKSSLEVSRISLIVTVILSLSMIIFAALNMAFQRSHNIKSVKPLCNIHQIRTNDYITISIFNAGLGPMLLTHVYLLKDDKSKLLTEVLPNHWTYDAFINNHDKYIIPSMGELTLFKFSEQNEPPLNDIKQLEGLLEGSLICLEYEDIYEHGYKKREKLSFN